MKLTFKQNCMNPNETKLFLDDKDITKYVQDIKISACANEITTAFIKLCPSELEFEIENVKLAHNDFTIEDMVEALSKQATIYSVNMNKNKLEG